MICPLWWQGHARIPYNISMIPVVVVHFANLWKTLYCSQKKNTTLKRWRYYRRGGNPSPMICAKLCQAITKNKNKKNKKKTTTKTKTTKSSTTTTTTTTTSSSTLTTSTSTSTSTTTTTTTVTGWCFITQLKNISQHGNLPQIGVNINHIWNHHSGQYIVSKMVSSVVFEASAYVTLLTGFCQWPLKPVHQQERIALWPAKKNITTIHVCYIFTYIWLMLMAFGWFWWQMQGNIPIPWMLWATMKISKSSILWVIFQKYDTSRTKLPLLEPRASCATSDMVKLKLIAWFTLIRNL